MIQIEKLNRKMASIVFTLAVSLLLVGCSSESPSSLSEEWLNAAVIKDKKTIAKYLCFPDLSPEKELLEIEETVEILTDEDLWGFEIKNELISANGESAIVTVVIKTERDIQRERDGEELKLFWVRTKVDGWKIDVEKSQ